MRLEHEAFFPPKQNCTIWRYMDLAKLLSLLEERALYFPRADMFEDPYEGALSTAGVNALKAAQDAGEYPASMVDQIVKFPKEFRRQMFISCWHANNFESAAMWKLYLSSNEGIAIRSDHEALVSALAEATICARTTLVRYLDYDREHFPFGNVFFPYVHKRRSFAHESELRAIIWRDEDVNKSQIKRHAKSVSIPINPESLIKAIHVAPTAPAWFGGLVQKLLKRYQFNIPVVKSNLYERPTY